MSGMSVRYSEAFKRQVVGDLERGKHSSIEGARRAYGIRGSTTVSLWVRKYGREDLLPKKVRIETLKERDELAEARKRIRELEAAVIGHLSYYAITDDADRCSYYVYRTKHILFQWLNRKSQRRAYTWKGLEQALAWAQWPTARIRKDLSPCRGAEAH